ncbi:MAG: hypothetical protein II653_06825 [Lachnospiraceae bacterium]|nr:hypothetical protein [Lachnospiraceae bacterium]
MVEEDMAVEAKSNVNKRLYKIELLLIKIIPYIIALCYIINTVLSYLSIEAEIFSMLCGISLLPLLFILMSSFVFGFCKYHRMMIYYVGISELLAWVDYYKGIPIPTNTYYILLFTLFGIFIFLFTYYKIKNK